MNKLGWISVLTLNKICWSTNTQTRQGSYHNLSKLFFICISQGVISYDQLWQVKIKSLLFETNKQKDKEWKLWRERETERTGERERDKWINLISSACAGPLHSTVSACAQFAQQAMDQHALWPSWQVLSVLGVDWMSDVWCLCEGACGSWCVVCGRRRGGLCVSVSGSVGVLGGLGVYRLFDCLLKIFFSVSCLFSW